MRPTDSSSNPSLKDDEHEGLTQTMCWLFLIVTKPEVPNTPFTVQMPEDEDTLEDLVRQLTDHQGDLFFYIRALCGNSDAAGDIRQLVNMILWRKRDAFRPGTSFKAWAFRIAQLEVKAFLRKSAKNKCFSFEPELFESLVIELPDLLDELPERRKALAECLSTLTPKDDELIRHHYWSDGTLDTLAFNTGRSVGTLKARLFQLRASLRRCIEGKLILTRF